MNEYFNKTDSYTWSSLKRDFLDKRRKINQDYANGRSPGIVSRVRGKSKVKELKKLEVEHVTTVQSYQEVKDELIKEIAQLEVFFTKTNPSEADLKKYNTLQAELQTVMTDWENLSLEMGN